jgi:beta-mannosidase
MRFDQQWQARAIRPDGASPWFPAEVPGNVQYDYGRMMGWGDINYGENVTRFRETEGYTWEYRTVLNYAPGEDERAVFVSEGIDYCFDILIGGEVRLEHEGMFTRVEVDLTDDIGKELVVRIHPHPKRETAEFEDRQEADQSVKPPVCYEWDWHPRMLVSGIWQDTYVETRKADWIRRCEPFYTLNEDRTRADIRFEVDCAAPVEITLFDPDGNEIGKGDRFTIENPRLWWCNGQGKPELYTYTARTPGHAVTGHIGLRTVRLVMNEGGWVEPVSFPKGRSVAPIQLELNGRRVFAKGSNWVNPDIYNGRIDEGRYEALITLARDANMNIFRCWGGSGINKRAFYELCDKMGIMVWVEFPLACNNYEGTPRYLEVLEQEASAIIRKLRSHPAVVMYCGGNELFNNWSLMTDQSLALRLLNKLCYDLDKERPFIMTSPVFGMGHGGYTFYDPNEKCDVFTLFQNSNCTAYTEFGVPGVTDLEELKKIIPEEELFPIRNMGSWKLHHAFGAWGAERWLCMDVLNMYAQEPLDTIEKVVAQAEWLQCEGYKAVFEEARRQTPYCSMAINWCYCEPWITAAGNSLITYPIKAKPAYYAVKSALRPVMASARIPRFDWKAGECFRAELWLLNDSPDTAGEKVRVSIKLDGAEYELFTWNTGDVDANANRIGPGVNFVLPDVDATEFTLCLETGTGASSEYRLCYRRSEAYAVSRQMNV